MNCTFLENIAGFDDEPVSVVPDDVQTLDDVDYSNDVEIDQPAQNEPPGQAGFDFEQHRLKECVRFWALKTNAPHSSINLVLHIFRTKTEEGKFLPKDARTLLRTDQGDKGIINIGGGRFWYNGVAKTLQNAFR